LREVINAHGLFASKALGQNFLFDEQLLDRLAAIPGSLMDANVLEVGPGPGGLTRALLRAGAKVTAIEMDKRALPVLEELSQAFPGRLTVIHGDATKVDPQHLRRRALCHRRQPALQCRHQPLHRLAERRDMAAAMDQPDADVPAGGGRAHHRPAGSDAYGRLAVLAVALQGRRSR
jgi:SAM-dependent methyltransferase